MIYNVINQVAKESSKKQKEVILKVNESPVLKEILYDTYNEFITYGVKKIDKPEMVGINTLMNDYDIVSPLLKALSQRELTGNKAKETIKSVMHTFTAEDQIIIGRIIGRDMEGGFSASTVNKVWSGLIPEFNVALAERYDKHPQLLTYDNNWLCSRKLDGCVHKDTIIELEKYGKIKIGDAFDKKIEDNVKSFNVITGEVEYKKILGYFKNGDDINEDGYQWFCITLEDNTMITLTGNHLVWLPKLNCYRRVDELTDEDYFLVES